ncbi:hypothetical protein [Kitasatospora sp. HPMI-4]|uniref:hypothetical protein n=1 Tax=Kitasatospora sp. HPMI-4 TaxID=3448443 RepID=UPI003F19A513
MHEAGARRQELVTFAARQAVGVVAPEELVFFEPLAAQFARRGELPRERRYADGVIGSGWDTAVMLISPVALALANSLYNRLLDNVSDEVLKRGGHGLLHAWRRLRRTGRTVPGLTNGSEVRASAAGDTGLREQLLSQAEGLGVAAEKAQALVDALLTAVEDGPPPQGAPESDDTGIA